MTLPVRDTQHHTYADYLIWSDGEREELIDGIAYVREPPAPSRSHQELVGELYYQVRLALEGKSCRAYIAPFAEQQSARSPEPAASRPSVQ